MPSPSPKIAIITGGAQGLGYACACRLAADQITCVLIDLNPEAVCKAANKLGNQHIGYGADVSDSNRIQAIFHEVRNNIGPISILINSAGITGKTDLAWKLDLTMVAQVMKVNFMGTYIPCMAAIPDMIEQKWGRIVNIASIAGKEGNPHLAPYSASKGAVIALTKSLGKELATTGVLVNAIAPAVIESGMNQTVSPETLNYMRSKIPMERLGRPEEVAELVAFLASERVSFSTGAVYDISGGRATY